MARPKKTQVPNFQKDSYGIVFSITTSVNMEATDALLLRIRNSDGVLLEKELTAGAITNTATGTVAYTVELGDLSTAGMYSFQIIDVTEGKFLPSVVKYFYVNENA
jgi:hypothetical protein